MQSPFPEGGRAQWGSSRALKAQRGDGAVEQRPPCSPSLRANASLPLRNTPRHPQPHRSRAGEADTKLRMCLLLRGALGGRMNPLSWGHCRFLTGHLGPGSAELSRPELGQGLFLLFLSKVTAPDPEREYPPAELSAAVCANKPFSPRCF